jgi:NADH dehydrogenase
VTHRVVIIGGGFGGLFAARHLRRAPVAVTVVDRTTHHLFQPLLYHVATGILSEGEIAPPIRSVLHRQRNAEVVLGEVAQIDLAARVVRSNVLGSELATPYDSLIVAAGGATSYFGHDEFALDAPGLKSIDDALELRARIFGAFEMAEREPEPAARGPWMTFIVVGAGATGVEMAGQIAELRRHTLRSDFRRIDTSAARIILLDGRPQILEGFDARLAERAMRELGRLGVEVHLGARVTGIDEHGVAVEGAGPELQRIAARTKIWAAGVSASPLGAQIAAAAGADLDRGGRVKVLPDCSLPGRPEVFVVGDLMSLNDLPGVAEVAMQSGIHAAGQIRRRLRGDDEPRPFRYRDLGSVASISRFYAVVQFGRIRVGGLLGWLVWLFVHLVFLTGFKNRVSALFHWAISIFGRARTERAITIEQVHGRRVPTAEAQIGESDLGR